MKKKVLIFLQSGVGGAERVSVTIGKSLDENKFNVVFVAVGPWENKIIDFIPPKFKCTHLKYSNPFMILMKMRLSIMREKPDIVFSSVMNLNTKLLLLKRMFFKKIRFVIRSDNNFSIFTLKQRFLIRALYNYSDLIISQTEEMKTGLVLAGIKSGKIVVLQNPIDTNRIDSSLECSQSPFPKNGSLHFVASGRFAESKGFDVLVSAFAKLKQEKSNIDLYILGKTGTPDNVIFKKVDEIVVDNKLENCVHYVDFLNNPYPYIKYADCFVLSSRYEGLPNVLIEALYLNTPVAATQCVPVISRIVQNGVNGFLAEVDSADSLKISMEKACMLGRVQSNYKPASNQDIENCLIGVL